MGHGVALREADPVPVPVNTHVIPVHTGRPSPRESWSLSGFLLTKRTRKRMGKRVGCGGGRGPCVRSFSGGLAGLGWTGWMCAQVLRQLLDLSFSVRHGFRGWVDGQSTAPFPGAIDLSLLSLSHCLIRRHQCPSLSIIILLPCCLYGTSTRSISRRASFPAFLRLETAILYYCYSTGTTHALGLLACPVCTRRPDVSCWHQNLKGALLGLEVLCDFGAQRVLEPLHLFCVVAEVHLAVEGMQPAKRTGVGMSMKVTRGAERRTATRAFRLLLPRDATRNLATRGPQHSRLAHAT